MLRSRDVDPQENEIELGDSDEDEHTSDQNESDNEDANAEFDISPASEDEMETIWFEDDVRLLQVGEERVVGGDLVPFLHLNHRQEVYFDLYALRTYDLCTSTTDIRTHDLCRSTTDIKTHDFCTITTGSRTDDLCISITDGEWIYTSSIRPNLFYLCYLIRIVHADDETSHHEGKGSYNETMRTVWINEGNHGFTERSDESRARSAWTTTARVNFKHLLYNVQRNAERVCASTYTNQWKEHRPVWMRKECWVELCGIWRGEKWLEIQPKQR
ncbi:hypothetical protein Taro_053773 [Colocasia esculenta]|uniref:Uncharacterized protein n=1 Tax=Colocasia esculenta TaxID=4460 RepID=A0A843XP39_COLES|nr:hypothetical protein [Colocasia esculenta]